MLPTLARLASSDSEFQNKFVSSDTCSKSKIHNEFSFLASYSLLLHSTIFAVLRLGDWSPRLFHV